MKTLVFLFSVLALTTTSTATVLTVNNQSGYTADFNNMPDAITAAVDGDTIYLQPSATGYGDIVLNKQLFILGPGHNPEFSNYGCSVGVITIQNGSSGSLLKGISIYYINGPLYQTANNLVISGCWIWAQNPFNLQPFSSWNNWIVEGNIIMSQSNTLNLTNAGPGWFVRNNILHCFAGSAVVTGAPAGMVFDHNIFLCTQNSGFSGIFNNVTGVIATNNIVYVTTTTAGAVDGGCTSCTWQNNVSYHPNITLSILPGTGNLDNTNPDFVNVPLLSPNFLYTNDYHLNSGSPALGTATDGTDIGIFGGIFPFRPEGIDNTLPRIKSITPLVFTAPPGGVFQINLKAAAAGN